MNKRKRTASKHAGSPKIAAKAQRAAQAVVRSRKNRPNSARAGTTASPPRRPNDQRQQAFVENPQKALQTVSQGDYKQTVKDSDSKKLTVFALATPNVQAYQAKLQEMAQANMQFAFDFAQKLVTIRSPLEISGVIAEFTGRWMAIFPKYSKEMTELRFKRSQA
jgi:phasin protein